MCPIVYDGITFDDGLRLDVLIENLVICELKADGKSMGNTTTKSFEMKKR